MQIWKTTPITLIFYGDMSRFKVSDKIHDTVTYSLTWLELLLSGGAT